MSNEESLEERTAKLLAAVVDRKTFLEFLDALIEEREAAEMMERERPKYYAYGGALAWQNSTISSFLAAASVYLGEGHFNEAELTWQAMARFLWYGKIYE
jgi:hypothetical protein